MRNQTSSDACPYPLWTANNYSLNVAEVAGFEPAMSNSKSDAVTAWLYLYNCLRFVHNQPMVSHEPNDLNNSTNACVNVILLLGNRTTCIANAITNPR